MPKPMSEHVIKVERTPDIFYKDRPKRGALDYLKDFLDEFHTTVEVFVCLGIVEILKNNLSKPLVVAISVLAYGIIRYFINRMIGKPQKAFAPTLTNLAIITIIAYVLLQIVYK
jgi:hypothetical protein